MSIITGVTVGKERDQDNYGHTKALYIPMTPLLVFPSLPPSLYCRPNCTLFSWPFKRQSNPPPTTISASSLTRSKPFTPFIILRTPSPYLSSIPSILNRLAKSLLYGSPLIPTSLSMRLPIKLREKWLFSFLLLSFPPLCQTSSLSLKKVYSIFGKHNGISLSPFRDIQPLIPPSYKSFPRHLPRLQQFGHDSLNKLSSVDSEWDILFSPTLTSSLNPLPRFANLPALRAPPSATSS